MSDQLQHIECKFSGIKFAENQTDSRMLFSGYGSVFGNKDSHGDVIEQGAFKNWISDVKSEKQDWPAMLLQHGGWGLVADDITPLGIWHDLNEDKTGLATEGEFADIQRSTEIYKLMKMQPRPAIKGLSIGYFAREWTETSDPNGPRRILKRIDVLEISIVTFPSNKLANVNNVKSALESPRQMERLLRDVIGFSQAEAKRFMAEGYKGIATLRDVGDDDHSSGDPSAELSEIKRLLQRNIQTLTA